MPRRQPCTFKCIANVYIYKRDTLSFMGQLPSSFLFDLYFFVLCLDCLLLCLSEGDWFLMWVLWAVPPTQREDCIMCFGLAGLELCVTDLLPRESNGHGSIKLLFSARFSAARQIWVCDRLTLAMPKWNNHSKNDFFFICMSWGQCFGINWWLCQSVTKIFLGD